MEHETLYHVPEIARRLQVSPDTVYRMVKSGELKAFRLRGSIVMKPADLVEFLQNLPPYGGQ